MYRSFSRVVYSLPFAKHKCLRSLEVVPQSLIPQCLVIRGISLSPLIYKEKVSERKSKKTKDTPPQKKETTEETLHVNLLVDTDRTKDELQATGWAAQPIKWTAQLDELLKEGVPLYKGAGWERVAKHVGHGLTGRQCKGRWNNYLRLAQKDYINQGEWTDKELQKLVELVPRCIVKPYWSERYKRMTQEHIDWSTIGARLNRIPSSCCTTWIGLQHSTMKQGSFTAEEDALITRGVAEWGDKRGKGLWVILQKEMGRPAKTILERWKTLNFKFRSSNSSIIRREELKGINHKIWTHEMDELLKEGVALYKEQSWARVAEHVGHGLTRQQCSKRWNCYIKRELQEGLQRGAWSTEEVRKLEELVPQHTNAPYQSETLQVQSKARIGWSTISAQLNRTPVECSYMWSKLLGSKMLQGPFTAEEDALITKRVAEWGDKGNGLWVSLQGEMNRPAASIRIRSNVLTKRTLKTGDSLSVVP